jgi:hypothetical protein
VIVVASGSDPRGKRLNLGHFAAGRWQLTSPDAPTDRAEVLVSGEGLQRDPIDVLGTLLHEAAHGLAHARKISDTSRQGRYHNRHYATLAAELDLDVAHLQPIGWSATSVPKPTAARYVEVLVELAAALVLWRRAEQAAPAGPGRSRNALACSCACGRRIRVARSVLELAPIVCGGCAQPFEPETLAVFDTYASMAAAISPSRTGRGATGPGCWHGSSLGLSMQASEGWANLPAATRPLQRMQPEAARGRVATDSDRQSVGVGVPVGGRGWQAYSYARNS